MILLICSCALNSHATLRMDSLYQWYTVKEPSGLYWKKWKYMRHTVYIDQYGKEFIDRKWVYSDLDIPLGKWRLVQVKDSTVVEYYTKR